MKDNKIFKNKEAYYEQHGYLPNYFAVMIILFFNRKIPMAFTSMGVIVALYVAGCVDKATVFAGFGNNNVLTMAGMFIVAAGLSRTQMVNNITKLCIV